MCVKTKACGNVWWMGNFLPLEVVGRGSETQLQVRKTFNYLISQFNG